MLKKKKKTRCTLCVIKIARDRLMYLPCRKKWKYKNMNQENLLSGKKKKKKHCAYPDTFYDSLYDSLPWWWWLVWVVITTGMCNVITDLIWNSVRNVFTGLLLIDLPPFHKRKKPHRDFRAKKKKKKKKPGGLHPPDPPPWVLIILPKGRTCF